MVIRKTGLSALVALPLVASLASAQGAPMPPSCSAQAPAMAAFDTTKAASLMGAFDLVMIDTTSLRGGVRQHVGKLLLGTQDSAPKRRASMAQRVQQKFMVGTFQVAAPDSGDMWNNMLGHSPEQPGVFWADGYFRLGDYGPKSGISLYPKLVTENEFRGMWTSHAGTGIVVDFTGDREPDEAGYFCARRVK